MRTPLITTLAAAVFLVTAPVAAADDEPVLDEETVLESLLTFDRPLHDELTSLRARVGPADPQYQGRLKKARGRVRLAQQHPDWAAADGKLAEVEVEVDRQVAAYRAATTDEEKQALYTELEPLAARAHDLRADGFRFRIAVLELRLQEMEQTVKAREENRDAFIEEYLDRKLGK